MLKGSKKDKSKGERLEIRLLKEEKELIEKLAKTKNVSMAALIVEAVKLYDAKEGYHAGV